MIYHDGYIVESLSTTTEQIYYICTWFPNKGKPKRGLSRINNVLRLYFKNQGVVEFDIMLEDLDLCVREYNPCELLSFMGCGYFFFRIFVSPACTSVR